MILHVGKTNWLFANNSTPVTNSKLFKLLCIPLFTCTEELQWLNPRSYTHEVECVSVLEVTQKMAR